MNKQVFETYDKWEDYKSGMYNDSDILNKDVIVFNCIDLFKSPEKFYNVCKNVISQWPVSTSVNLTNRSQNRRAWIGAASCCIEHNAPEYITRIAWNLLNKDIQDTANRIADKAILEYEKQNSGIYPDMGATLLF